MDWRFFGSGIALIAAGIAIAIIFGALLTTGPIEEFNQNRGIAQLGGLVGAIGILLLLVSFGLSRRKKDAAGKAKPSGPDEPS
jgi:hypothetical protein